MINLPKMPSMSLEGKTAIVTGASSGIGQGAAAALSGAGASVICVARGQDRLVETEKALKENGWQVTSEVADVNQHSKIQNIFASFVFYFIFHDEIFLISKYIFIFLPNSSFKPLFVILTFSSFYPIKHYFRIIYVWCFYMTFITQQY